MGNGGNLSKAQGVVLVALFLASSHFRVDHVFQTSDSLSGHLAAPIMSPAPLGIRNLADKQGVMVTLPVTLPASSFARSELLFLEYRLAVISKWPPSPRKKATSEAISRRLTSPSPDPHQAALRRIICWTPVANC